MGRRMGYRYQRIEIQKEPRERLISDLLLLLLLKIEKFLSYSPKSQPTFVMLPHSS